MTGARRPSALLEVREGSAGSRVPGQLCKHRLHKFDARQASAMAPMYWNEMQLARFDSLRHAHTTTRLVALSIKASQVPREHPSGLVPVVTWRDRAHSCHSLEPALPVDVIAGRPERRPSSFLVSSSRSVLLTNVQSSGPSPGASLNRPGTAFSSVRPTYSWAHAHALQA